MANQYVNVHYDSFKNKTTAESYQLKYKLDARRLLLTETVKFNFRHVSCEPDLDALLIDVHFKSIETNRNAFRSGSLKEYLATYPGEWAFLRNGQLIIQINGVENIPLQAHESASDVTKEGLTNASACEELVYYEIDRGILEKICKANTVMMQLSGDSGQWTIDGTDMIFLAKTFYNGIFDESMYADEIFHAAHAEDVAKARKQIKKKGCLIETVSVFIGVTIFGLISETNVFVAMLILIIFILIIPIYVVKKSRKKASEIQ